MRISFLPIGLACIAANAFCAEVPLLDFARHEQYQEMKISPDGVYLAVSAVIKGRPALSVIRRADLALNIVKGINVRGDYASDIEDFSWVGRDQIVYSMGKFNGHHAAPLPTGELYIVNADGARNRRLFGGADKLTYVVGNLISALPEDPQHALVSRYRYIGSNSADAPSEAYRIDLEKGSTELIAVAPVRQAQFVSDNHGVIRMAHGKGPAWEEKVYYRADDKAAWNLVFDESKDPGAFFPLGFDRSGNGVYAVCDGEHRSGGLCRWNSATRESVALWSGAESGPIQAILGGDGSDVVAVVSMPDRPLVDVLDQSAPERGLLADLYRRFPGQLVTLGSASRDGSKRVVTVESDTNPGDFYLYDADSKTLTKVLSRMAWIKPESMATMEPIKLLSRDGLPLRGYVTRPTGKEGAKNLPLVVLVHGGPYGIRDMWEFNPQVQMLASHGYAVLQANFRGSGGYGSAFEKAGHGEWGTKMQDDITDATRWAVGEGIADPHRICIYGASFGGFAALRGAEREPDLYACAIGAEGIYDLPAWVENSDVSESLFGRSYLRRVLGEDAAQLHDRSPINHLDKLKAKVMLIVGGADKRVPPAQGEALHEALLQRKIDHAWLYQRNEGHGYYDEAHVADMYTKILAFLDSTIGDGNGRSAAH